MKRRAVKCHGSVNTRVSACNAVLIMAKRIEVCRAHLKSKFTLHGGWANTITVMKIVLN